MESATDTRRLGRYHIGDPVGGGPTGEVFRARVHGVAGFERQFALKKFHPQLASDENALNVLRGAVRLYAALEHPRIARLHEHHLEGDTPYVAVEWVGGLDLARLIDATFGQGQPLPAGAATSLLSRAARAVGYAHGRGHAHLGLAPTNLLCTSAGEIKVTDFGLLPARLGKNPDDDSSLFARTPYLAPEQLRGESTSPATDVFCLGALFYELLIGKKAFSGRSGRDVSAAILGAKPSTDVVPKPLARVLDRCFAQSPFERYPSGGALADAVDAASRGMLMRGDQRDAAKAVQTAIEHSEKLRSQQVSGVLSFPIPAPPSTPRGRPGSSAAIASQRSLGVPNLELDESVHEESPTDILPAESMRTGAPLAASMPSPYADYIRPPTSPQAPASQTSPPTGPPTGPPTRLPSAPLPSAVFPTGPILTPSATPAPAFASNPDGEFEVTVPFDRAGEENQTTSPRLTRSAKVPELIEAALDDPPMSEDMTTSPRLDPPQPVAHVLAESPAAAAPPRPSSEFGAGLLEASKPRSRQLAVVLVVAGAIAIAIFGMLIVLGGKDGPKNAGENTATPGSGSALVSESADASVAISAPASDAGPSLDASQVVATARQDASPASPADAGITELVVESVPKRATVYLDGTKIGKTPVTVDTARDQHRLVLIRAGHKLHIEDIKGGSKIKVEMEEVTPSGGPAGIKVRCRQRNRYYVWVDGKETGQLCPTERIEVDLGEHTVEVYDPVTDSRRRFDVDVTQTRRSHRIRVDF